MAAHKILHFSNISNLSLLQATDDPNTLATAPYICDKQYNDNY